MKPAKILYFINGVKPTPEDLAAAADMKATVCFRNAKAVPNEAHAMEKCDGVAGAVPDTYAEAFPKAEAAIKAKADELAALSRKVGDKPAPTTGTKKPADGAPAGDKDAKAPAWKPGTAKA